MAVLTMTLSGHGIRVSSARAEGRAVAGVTVRGRVELINTRLKPRNGRIDASGVVVWLEPLDGPVPRGTTRQKVVLDQRNKRFVPHVVAIETGSMIDFPNGDPFFHNVFSIYNGKKFDLGLYASGETRPVSFNRPGISYIFCNIHPQMSAVVVVVDTPYFAVSDNAGAVALSNVAPGRYQLKVWHERALPETLAALSRTVVVSPAGMELGGMRVSEEGYVPRPHPNKHGQEYDPHAGGPGYRGYRGYRKH
jgi:plastocyanin